MVIVSWDAAVIVSVSDMNSRNSSREYAGRKVYCVSPPPTSRPLTLREMAYP
jgi:hypothetical protein